MRFVHLDHIHDVVLVDDGTLDTVIRVDGRECRFDSDDTVEYRRPNGSMRTEGLRSMAEEACDVGLLDDLTPETNNPKEND